MSDISVDAMGRRLRERRVPTDKIKRPTNRVLIWLEKLYRHGPLPSSYLHAYTEHLRRNAAWSRRELADLFHEDSIHGGPYLSRPWQQFNTLDARHHELVYDIAPAGIAALKDVGIPDIAACDHSGPWVHRCMVACITASIELAAARTSNVRFIFRDTFTTAPRSCPVPVAMNGQRQERNLIPDAVFALGYHTESGERYRLFALEADRSTEPGKSRSLNRKSYLQTIQSYREYVGAGRYKEHLGVSAPMLVLNVTTGALRQRNLVAHVEQAAEGRGNSFMLFQNLPLFGRHFVPPKPMPDLLHGPWQRAEHGVLYIDIP